MSISHANFVNMDVILDYWYLVLLGINPLSLMLINKLLQLKNEFNAKEGLAFLAMFNFVSGITAMVYALTNQASSNSVLVIILSAVFYKYCQYRSNKIKEI